MKTASKTLTKKEIASGFALLHLDRVNIAPQPIDDKSSMVNGYFKKFSMFGDNAIKIIPSFNCGEER